MTNLSTWRLSSVIIALILMLAMAGIAVPAQPVLAAAGVWTLQTVDPTEVRDTSIALDSDGYPHISYYDVIDGNNVKLKYARWTGSAWVTEIVDSPLGDPGCTSIVLDRRGYPHISYYDEPNVRLKYAYWTGSGWHIEAVSESGTNGRDSSLALDSNDYPHISWSGGGVYHLMYTRWTGSAWETPTNIDEDARHKSLALDSNGYPHISYFVAGSANYLKYASFNGTSWTTEIVDTPPLNGFLGNSNSLALDSSNLPHIAYSAFASWDTPKTIKYASWTGSAWAKEIVDSSILQFGSVSMALDSSNRPHISYTSVPTDDSLYYARWTGSAWAKEIVDPNDFRDTSIALDSGGYPHISYATSHGGAGSLHYAHFVPTPTVTAVNPNSGQWGQILIVSITGNNFNGATTVNFGPGVTVTGFTVNSDLQITANISIAPGAVPGARDVSVTTPGGNATLMGAFTVYPLNQILNQGSGSSGSTGTLTSTPTIVTAAIVVQSAALSAKSVTPGTPVTVTADITNKSTVNGNKKVTLYVNGQVVTTQGVTVNSGSSSKLTFNVSRSEPGDYSVYVDGVPAGSFKVEMVTANDAILIFSVALVALAFIAGLVMLWRRQRAG